MTLYDKGKKASWNWGADGKYIKPGGFICMNVDAYAEASTVADQGRATYSVCVPASRA
jgi:hypothetical protein